MATLPPWAGSWPASAVMETRPSATHHGAIAFNAHPSREPPIRNLAHGSIANPQKASFEPLGGALRPVRRDAETRFDQSERLHLSQLNVAGGLLRSRLWRPGMAHLRPACRGQKLGGVQAETTTRSPSPMFLKACGLRLSKK